MTPVVRQVGGEALDLAAPLLLRFFAEEGFATPPGTIRSRLASLLADDTCTAFLAWDGPAVVGVATLSTSFGIEYGRSAELDDLYVLPEARRRGIARALIEAARRWCRAQRCTVLLLTVTPEAQDAHDLVAFYLRNGFQDLGRKLLSYDLMAGSAPGGYREDLPE